MRSAQHPWLDGQIQQRLGFHRVVNDLAAQKEMPWGQWSLAAIIQWKTVLDIAAVASPSNVADTKRQEVVEQMRTLLSDPTVDSSTFLLAIGQAQISSGTREVLQASSVIALARNTNELEGFTEQQWREWPDQERQSWESIIALCENMPFNVYHAMYDEAVDNMSVLILSHGEPAIREALQETLVMSHAYERMELVIQAAIRRIQGW